MLSQHLVGDKSTDFNVARTPKPAMRFGIRETIVNWAVYLKHDNFTLALVSTFMFVIPQSGCSYEFHKSLTTISNPNLKSSIP